MNTSLRQHIISALTSGQRLDGRALTDYRQIEVETGIAKTAEGSARVRIGQTEVVAGVKLIITTPFPDTPDVGSIMVNAEFLPLSSPEFESGPPGVDSIELARVIDRGIRESKGIDIKELCITKGEKCWTVSIDVCTINAGGNLLDAAALASIIAIKDARFPEFDGVEVNYKKKTNKQIPLSKTPIAVTVYKLGRHLLVDPTDDEEKAAEARLTVTTTKDNHLCALQKGGSLPLTIEDVTTMIDLAVEKAKELRKFV